MKFPIGVIIDVYKRQIESHAEALRHFHGGYSVVKLLDDSALEFNVYHKNFSFQLGLPLCRITADGGVRYWQEDVATPERERACE